MEAVEYNRMDSLVESRVYEPEYAMYLTSAGGILSSLGHNLSLTTCTCVNCVAMNKISVSN